MKIGFSGHRRGVTVDIKWLNWVKRKFPSIKIWVHGGAEGFDTQVDRFARQNGIATEKILPDYENYPPKTAPLTRNRHIVAMSELMVFAWDGRKYGGTYYTMTYSAENGVPFICLPIKIKNKPEPREKKDSELLVKS